MIRNIATSLALTTIALTGLSQDNEYKSATDYAVEGATFYADEEYEQAFEAFRKVNYNDTAYFSLTLAALESASKTDMIDSIIEITTVVLEDERFNPFKESYVIMKGFGLLQKEDNDEAALAFYDGYTDEFPTSSVIQYNRSVALYNLKRYDEAVEALQTAIRYNPRYAAAHIKLGLICAEAEDYTKAALCMNMALFHSAADDNALSLIATLENIYAQDMETQIGKVNYREDEDFDEIDLLIENKVAESKKYKIGFKFPYNVFKHNHLVFDQIEYDESSNGFWNQNYVRFFQEIMEQDLFNYFSYFQCIRVENPKVQKTLNKNTSRIRSSVTEIADFFAKFMNERTVWDGTKYVENDLIHYGSYGFNAKVKTDENGKQTGPYVAYDDKGLVEAEGTLDADGKQDGLWTFYEDGVLSLKTVFKAGELDGTRSSYYGNGSLSQRFDVVDKAIDGKLELFTAFNQLFKEVPYDNGKENGTLKAYYNTGELYVEQEYKDGELNGKSTYYFASGEVKSREFYVDGEMDGEYADLYRDGSYRTKGQYTEGEPSGHWEYYYDNGQLREQGDFKNGLRIGLWKRFSKNGKLSEETNYGETGKKVGVYKEYDLDEKLILELTYKGEEIIDYKTYDENGKILGQGEKKRRELEFENYWSNGQLRAKGNYYKGNKVGTWKYYNQYGVLTDEEPHNEEGELHGITRSYFDNGQLETSITYKDGEQHGLVEDFYRNGILYKRGFMHEGESVGEWRFYYRDGTLSSTAYFLDGERTGDAVFYDEKGRKNEVMNWYRGVLQYIEQFDTNGVSLYKMELTDGKNPDVHFVNSVGKVVQDRAYDGAQVNGNSVFYYGNGEIRSKGFEVDGDNHGEWEWFHENGKIETRGSYDYGTRVGKWMWYFDNGQLSIELNYDDGDVEGKRVSYYRDGTLEAEETYRNDEIHGKCTYYDEAGEVLIIRFFKDGRMLGYSYIGTDGKEVDMIPFDNQNGLIETFFKNGNKAYSVEYKEGYKHGKSVEYHSNGKEAIVRQFEKGQLVGERKQYYKSGKLKNVGTYYYGERHNTRTSYYENGKVKSVENYIMGTLYGRAVYYKSNGTIEREVQYYDGSQIND